jgi:hypothetical protein
VTTAKNKRLKTITLTIGAISVECQVTSWKLNPPQNVGDIVRTFCPDGSFREEVDADDWTLDLKWVTDWTAGGLNRYLWANQDATAAFVLTNYPTTTGWAVQWSGSLVVKAPSVGGERGETDMSEMTFTGVGDLPVPTYPVVP